jgi:HD-GYP domain-containing protein (c-di-GMP phosphodiesterase class II)
MTKSNESAPSRGRTVLGIARGVLLTVFACAVLATVTIVLGPLAAVAVVCAALWLALFVSLRRLSKERRSVDAKLSSQQERYDYVVGVLCGALHLKDDLNTHHTTRVLDLATIVATEMGMRRDDVRLLRKASILADVGKLEIASSILNKAGALSDDEWTQMKLHPDLGLGIVGNSKHLQDAGDIVIAHHERFDGQGYPRGLKGEEIPLGARIFAVVDAYVAMTTDRPHRKRMTHEMAVQEIFRNSLTQFDPEVVRAFVRCDERGLIKPRVQGTDGASASQPSVATVV